MLRSTRVDPRTVRARVTWIQRPRTVRELFQIGVELEVPGNVWGIAFPPGDWFPFPEAASNLEIPAPFESSNAESSESDWNPEPEPAAQAQEPVEHNVRVLPLPGGGDARRDASVSHARHHVVGRRAQRFAGTAFEAVPRATPNLLSATRHRISNMIVAPTSAVLPV